MTIETTRFYVSSELIQKNFADTTLTFSVEHMWSPHFSICYPQLMFYNNQKVSLQNITGDVWLNGKNKQSHSHTFTFDESLLEEIGYYRVRFIFILNDKDNPVYFNHIQLCEGTESSYHQPAQNLPKTKIRYNNSFYSNLYSTKTDSYLQIIRPYFNDIDTETLTKSKVTVLAPHLINETDVDSPSSIGLEFMNQNDQVIEILR